MTFHFYHRFKIASNSGWIWFCLVFGWGMILGQAQPQDQFLEESSFFLRKDLSLDGRLRQLTLQEVFPDPGKEIIILERTGTYPQWKMNLSIWSWGKNSPIQKAKILLASDTLFYDFVPLPSSPYSSLIFVRPKQVEVWIPSEKEKTWSFSPSFVFSLDTGFPSPQPGQTQPLSLFFPSLKKEPTASSLFVPLTQGLAWLSLTSKGIGLKKIFSFDPRTYYKSSIERKPFDISFSLRSSLWHASIFPGHYKNFSSDFSLFLPWMDEVMILPLSSLPPENLFFRQMDNTEREDGKTYVVLFPEDLNGDGWTDFIVNKFQGEFTSLKAETRLFLTTQDGTLSEKGQELKPFGNRAGGALALDLNLDQKKDLVVASSDFNAMAIIRALVQRQIKIVFAFYFFHPDGYHLEKPDFTREISYDFSLQDLMIDGIFPSLEGDFNGDGYPDAIYARNRRTLTVLIQKPNSKELFSTTPSGTYEVTIPRFFVVGDLNGDQKSDVVLFEKKSSGNQKVIVLLNAGFFQ